MGPPHNHNKPVGMLPLSTLDDLTRDVNNAVIRKRATIHLGLSPGTLSNIKQGLEAQLLPQLNKYYPPLEAVLLGWSDLKLSSSTGMLLADTACVHVNVVGQFYVFTPKIGAVLSGVVNKKSAGHVGCLVHDTFNVSLMSERTDKSVDIGDTIMIQITKLFWGHKSLPVIQGKMFSMTAGEVKVSEFKEEEEIKDDVPEQDYDSGIDSNGIGVVPEENHEEVDEKDSRKSKKSKKRKLSETDPDLQTSIAIDSSLNSSASKKKKKKKRESKD